MAKRPRRVRAAGLLSPDRYQRHEAPWPADKPDVTPFVYDPARRVLIASFPRTGRLLSLAERQTVERVQRAIARLERIGELPAAPFWPGSGSIAPVGATLPGWLVHLARDHHSRRL